MATFLDRVQAQKRKEIARKRRVRPSSLLEEAAAGLPVRDFAKALMGGGRIIAEIKGKSPRAAAFRQSGFPSKHLAAIYEKNGAAAISIVTDEPNFGTSLRDVQRIRGSVALPVLAKDFIIDPYQVVEARAAGADGILLIARLLSCPFLKELLGIVHRFGAAALIECHDEKDIEKAVAAGARIIGINNRDLGTLEVSLDTTRRLLPKIPRGMIRVAESGFSRREQIVALTKLGVDAFLIGGALLDADDPGKKLAELDGRIREGEGR